MANKKRKIKVTFPEFIESDVSGDYTAPSRYVGIPPQDSGSNLITIEVNVDDITKKDKKKFKKKIKKHLNNPRTEIYLERAFSKEIEKYRKEKKKDDQRRFDSISR